MAAAVTAAMFAVAFVSMRSVAPWSDAEREPASTPLVVPLRPPPAAPRKETPVVPAPQPAPRIRTDVTPAPPTVTAAPRVIAPIVAPLAPPTALPTAPPVAADTARARDVAPAIPTVPTLRRNSGLADTAMTIRGGAPSYAPAGVTNASRAKNTAKLRDSVITEKLEAINWLTAPMSAEAKSGIAQSQDQARMLMQRSTSVGMTNGLYVPMGSGVGGVGAVNGGKTGVTMDSRGVGVSLPFPLFSPGPSPAERKRNEKLHAEYLAYLRHEQEVILLRRDSIRADSLRLDSLAKKRALIRP
ncbi:MAG TPA: hypothetical protein VNS10_22640 [Gemmatimonadaceae bacterium]|nr:hypothetical protein [Gemmatimonadaceae bacterium]